MKAISTHYNKLFSYNLLFLCLLIVMSLFLKSIILAMVAVIFVLAILVRIPELALAMQINGAIIYFYALYKAGLTPETIITGLFQVVLISCYLIGGWRLNKKKIKIIINNIDKLFIAFFALVLMNSLFLSKGNDIVLKKLSFIPFYVFAPYIAIRMFQDYEMIKRTLTFCVLIAAIMIIPSFWELKNQLLVSARFSPFMFTADRLDNPVLFGLTYAMTLLLIFFWTFEKGEKIKLWWALIAVPSTFLLFRSGARGPVVALASAILIYVLFTDLSRLGRKVLIILLLSLTIYGGIKLVPGESKNYYLASLQYEQTEDRSIEGRFDLQEAAINEFLGNPVLGIGLGNSAMGTGFPHNLIIEVAAEFGSLGLILFLTLLGCILKEYYYFLKIVKDKKIINLMKCSFGLLIFFFTCAMFSGHLSNQIGLYFSIGLISTLINIVQNVNGRSQKIYGQNQ